MPTIAVVNPKGGAGKTTVSICLARALEADGSRVLLVDSDPQGSARDWQAVTDDNPTTVVGLDRPGALRSLPEMQTGYAWTVIDGAGRHERITADAVGVADLVLIPIQPAPFDVWALNPLMELVSQRQSITGGSPVAGAIITRASAGTVLDREITDALTEIGLEVMDTRWHQRQAWPRAANEGTTPLEYEPAGKAATEIRAAADEIRRLFDGDQ